MHKARVVGGGQRNKGVHYPSAIPNQPNARDIALSAGRLAAGHAMNERGTNATPQHIVLAISSN